MDRLWADGPQTRTYAPPTHPQPPIAEPPFTAPPAAPPPSPQLPPAAGGGGGRSPWLAAVGGGTVSALLVTAVLLGTGIAGGDDQQVAPAGTTPPPAVVNASDAKGDLVRSVYAAASPSVVSVLTQSGSGTGFLADGNGTIVTNAHVVGDASQVKVRFEDGGELHDAEVLGVDESVDLAALKVDADAAKGVRPLRFADSDSVQVGDSAVAIGYPLGLDRTATAGIVSGLERKIDSPNGFSIDKVIQTDAPINPGNSGGPLLDSNAQVIGVNSQIATAGGSQGSVGIGFAIPASTVKEVLPQLARGVTPEHAYLGLSTSAAPNGGAQVADVTAGAPAEKAGLIQGDVVTKVDGDDVQVPDDVAAAIEDNKPGDQVDVTVQRGGSDKTVQVTLGQRPEQIP